MAKFQIVRAKGTLPGVGPSVRADMDVRTGGRLTAEAISGLGKAIQQEAIRYDLIEAATQFDTAKRLSREEINRLSLSFDGNLEPDTYHKEYEKSVGTIRSYMPKNRRAARAFESWLSDRSPQWALGVEDSRRTRIADNFKAEGFELKTESERTGDVSKYKMHLAKGKRLGIYDAEETAILNASAEHGAELSLAKRMALNFPEATLGTIKGDKFAGFDTLTPDDILRIRNIANSTITQNQIAIEQRDDEIGEAFLKLLINKLDPEKEQLTFDIIADSELSLDAKEEWFAKLRVFDNYSEQELKEAFQDQGPVLADVLERVEENKITDAQIRGLVGKGLSPQTADSIIKDREIWRQHWYKETEQLFKRIFGWTPELGFGEKKFAPFAYEKVLREWKAEVKVQDATGEKIIEIGRAIVRPYFVEYLKKEFATDEDIPRIVELALGEEIEEPEPTEIEKPEIEESPKPATLADFEAEVSRLKAIDMKRAREYYDKWVGGFK